MRDPRYVETVPKRGYRLIAPVETNVDAPPPAAPKPATLSQRRAWPALQHVISGAFASRALGGVAASAGLRSSSPSFTAWRSGG